ncbi:right-handed parallel beta-helix repeat-containing protein [Paenibacillus selenitireducens]|uniref:right-handed parallel beta-helix repeat-containing protein n=1 Tax=Paenibacillus selenitireducens TaxID=1324314 RepID=UPI001E2F5496|nr:right-handed parallel beta-helix repeat-containing protein [Paenibacillus selenitireducens]
MFKGTAQKIFSLVVAVVMFSSIAAVSPTKVMAEAGNTYYVDNVSGDDNHDGTDQSAAWKTLAKVNATTFAPGDKILFKAGGSWQGQLWPKGSGTDGSPIVIDKYGTGNKPLIAGVTSELSTVFLKNQEYWEINNLEVTNPSSEPFTRDWKGARGERRGVYILNEESGILNHIYIKNLNVHDVDGVYTTRSGGIIFDSVGSIVPSAFHDILIDGNTLTDVDAYGIYISSNCIIRYGMGDLWEWVPKPYGPWTPSTGVKISNNTIVRAATGGIAWNVTDGAVVERNTVQEATYLATNASIWWAYADNNVVQFNESFASRNGSEDGTGFDVDAGNLGSLVQYNYSHDNAGGFMLYVNDTYNTINTIVRYNISQNDKGRIFRYSGSIDTVMNYNNTIYVGAASGNPVMSDYFTKASGSPKNIKNYNNIYYSVGDRGWTLTGQTFDHNAYFGGKTLVSSDAHKITANPKLLNPGSGGVGMNTVVGYQLQSDSPLIGVGVPIADNGGRDYFGNSLYNGDPDIGAFEYQGTVPPATNKPPIVFTPAPITPLPKPPGPAVGNLAPLATASASIATLSGSSIKGLNDGLYDKAWSSVDKGVTFPNYITLDFGARTVTVNNMKVVTRFGTGQGVTSLDIEAYDGTSWIPVKTGVQWVWQSNDQTNETKSVDFTATSASKFRLKMNGANLKWGNFAINELELYNLKP